nr:dihydrolipoyl dehydrogenase [uncultured Oscillibacter sp.]
MNLAIIGGGPGGYVAAIRASQLGADVTLIEKDAIGGTCLNVGCIPTKSLIHSADLYHAIIHEAASNGISVGEVSADFDAMQKRKAKIVKKLVSGVSGLMSANRITVVKGSAKFQSASLIKATTAEGSLEIPFDKAIIASGSVPSSLPIPGADLEGVVESTGALSLEAVPASMCVIGGGVIGVEMAHIYCRLGTKITIVEMLPDILMTQDAEVVAPLKKVLKADKTDILLETKVNRIEKAENGLTVHVTAPDGSESSVTAEKVLMCVGRRPATENLGLDEIGIATERRRILVDAHYRTSVESIYAIGDCIGGIMLAHVASAEGVCAAEHCMGLEPSLQMDIVPSCIYTSPELSGVGLTEKEALTRGLDIAVGVFPLMGNGKSLILGDTTGLVKYIADKNTHKILGLHMCGPNATELIVEGALAISKKATVEDILSVIHAHPTVGESLQEAAHSVFGNCFHMPPRR